jgi:hypothetical protein
MNRDRSAELFIGFFALAARSPPDSFVEAISLVSKTLLDDFLLLLHMLLEVFYK